MSSVPMEKTKLAPGFRFHPTDVELVRYYLKRKVLGKKFHVNAISDIDIYKFEPPDLPEKSCLGTGDLKWYFFCPRDYKYLFGRQANRTTECGFWKITGRDRDVCYKNDVVGKIKTLIYHYGKKPQVNRTDWVIHEYRLEDKALALKKVPQDTYVLCVLFKKNGLGPRHGSQYGAPFNEEDWSDEEEEATQNLLAVPYARNAGVGPSKETCLAATASQSHAPKDCFEGVISESCVSDVPPLIDTMLPILTNDVVARPLIDTVLPILTNDVVAPPLADTELPILTNDVVAPPLADTVLPILTNDVVACTPLSSTPLPEVPQLPPDDDELDSMLNLFTVDNDESLLLYDFNYQNLQVRDEPGVSANEEASIFLGDDGFSEMLELSDDLFIELQNLIQPATPPPAQASNPDDSRSNGETWNQLVFPADS